LYFNEKWKTSKTNPTLIISKHNYLIKGYALNKERLQQRKLDELNATIELIKSNIYNNEHDL